MGERQTKEKEGDEINLADCCCHAPTSVRGMKFIGCGHISHFINLRNFDLEFNFSSMVKFVTKGNEMINAETGKVDRNRPIVKLTLIF